MSTAKAFVIGVVTSVLAAVFVSLARAGTVILSTTTIPGVSPSSFTATALPGVGAYEFDIVAKSSGPTAFSTFDMYLQQQGISGDQAYYSIFNSTITQCTGACTRYVVPDVYLGGNIRAWYTITGSSVTILVTARPVTP